MKKKFTWTVKITVDESWVADGFDLQDGRGVTEALQSGILQYASSAEVNARVVAGPKRADVAKVQGFKDVAAMNKANVNLS